jgi:streptogramin lyase
VGIAVEPDGSLVVADESEAVVRVAPDTGDRTMLSGCAAYDPEPPFSCTASIGTGPPFYPVDIAVEPDGSLVVADESEAVVRVAPDTGDRTMLSGCAAYDPEPPFSCTASIGTGPPLVSPKGIAVDHDGSLVIADGSVEGVMRVNPVTGERTLVSGFDRETNMNIGNGPLLAFPEAIDVEANGSLIVVDSSLYAVVRVDPLTGNRTLISR